MKLAFVLPIYRNKTAVFDGPPLSLPILIGGLRSYFPAVNFEQIDLNKEADRLINDGMVDSDELAKIKNMIESICSRNLKGGAMTANRLPIDFPSPGEDDFNFFEEFFKKIYSDLKLADFDYYFLSVYQIYNEDVLSMLLFAQFLKKIAPHKKIIIGGIRNLTKSFIDKKTYLEYIDTIIAGNAVESCRELIADLINEKSPKALYASDKKTLDNLNLPDYESFRHLELFAVKGCMIESHYKIEINKNSNESILCIPYKFSLGCFWHKCSYCGCSLPGVGLKIKKIPEIISDIKKLKKNSKSKFFIFYNNNFNSSLDFAKQLAQAIIDNKLDILWTDSFNLRVLDDELINLLARSGCIRMDIGLVTLNNVIQKMYNNVIQDDECLDNLKKIDNAGIWTDLNLIANLPHDYEIDNEIEKFSKIISHIDAVTLNSYRAYYSEMYLNPEKFNLRKIDEHVSVDDFSAPMYFVENDFSGTIDERKKLFADNFIKLRNFLQNKGVMVNRKAYYLLVYLYHVFGHKNKNTIKKYMLSAHDIKIDK